MCLPGKESIGVAMPSPNEYDEEWIGESPPDAERYSGEPPFESALQSKQRELNDSKEELERALLEQNASKLFKKIQVKTTFRLSSLFTIITLGKFVLGGGGVNFSLPVVFTPGSCPLPL